MKDQEIHSELASIRALMERSAKFISLSGLSGIMAGIYAIIGAAIGYCIVYGTSGGLDYRDHYISDQTTVFSLFLIALTVLALSLSTGILLTVQKAKRKGETVWNPASKRLLVNMAIPLITGGILIIIFLLRGYYGIIAPSCLIFYGLSLVSGSHYTVSDVKWLGIYEILLGLIAACLPGYGIVFWTIGFGVLHIIYGSIMHFRYDK
ncbi:MAG: hypothetical protein EOO92_02365 [Pedobacter sp.]|nr:MAG: hypothetical protein EOO92_02365 [Pedobacter sp.]